MSLDFTTLDGVLWDKLKIMLSLPGGLSWRIGPFHDVRCPENFEFWSSKTNTNIDCKLDKKKIGLVYIRKVKLIERCNLDLEFVQHETRKD